MARGRPPGGVRLVEALQGSSGAKAKLRVILQTLGGERSAQSACQELGICEAAFYKLRGRGLQAALESLEPRARGRPPKEIPPELLHQQELELEVKQLQRELKASHVREELAVAMPQLVLRRQEAEKKTRSRPDRRPTRR